MSSTVVQQVHRCAANTFFASSFVPWSLSALRQQRETSGGALTCFVGA
jgi:hypothetical protein